MCLDPHEELVEAWSALVRAGFPKRATALFHDVNLVNYDNALGRISEILSHKDKIQEVSLARDLSSQFRRHYQITTQMARRGE